MIDAQLKTCGMISIRGGGLDWAVDRAVSYSKRLGVGIMHENLSGPDAMYTIMITCTGISIVGDEK